jgi:hypothetical protein
MVDQQSDFISFEGTARIDSMTPVTTALNHTRNRRAFASVSTQNLRHLWMELESWFYVCTLTNGEYIENLLLTYLLTYLRSWALPEKLPIVQQFRKFPAILRNPKVHHCVHKRLPLVPILSQFDPDWKPLPGKKQWRLYFNVRIFGFRIVSSCFATNLCNGKDYFYSSCLMLTTSVMIVYAIRCEDK